MSLNYQFMRNFVQQRRNVGRLYSFQVQSQNVAAGPRLRGLHSLSLKQIKTGSKLDSIIIANKRWTRGKLLEDTRPLVSIVVISRNESTSTNVSESSANLNTNSKSSTSESATTSSSTNSTAANEGSVAQSPPVVQSSENAASLTSNVDAPQDALLFEKIPEPPQIPLEVEELALNALGEPTFASLGLGGWTPSGIVQNCLEFFHVNLGMPWWGSILTGTIIVRLLLFPLVVKSQRNAAKMQNHMPELQTLQMKMTEARQTGNALMAAKYGQDMMQFMKEKDISPFKSMLVPLAMAPVFISCFFGLRKMANLPVESMKTGGLYWFTDLTVADPYYLLPLITSVTVWVTLEVGADGMKLNAATHGQLLKYFFRAIPFIMFPFTMNFPAAILCYWVSTNAISLVQVSVLKIPAVRQKLKIEAVRKFTPEMLPGKKKGFRESFKETWTNMKITNEIENRQRHDELSFKRAGRGPIPKTFKYDPTKVTPQTTAVQAKQK